MQLPEHAHMNSCRNPQNIYSTKKVGVNIYILYIFLRDSPVGKI